MLITALSLFAVMGLGGCKSKSSSTSDNAAISEATKPNAANNTEEAIPVAADFEDQVIEEITPDNTDAAIAAIEAELDAL